MTLTGDEARHIVRVLRLKRDDEIVLFDATGAAYSGRIAERTADAVTVRITETFAAESPDAPQVVLVQAVLKSQKMDLIVQKSTELGRFTHHTFFFIALHYPLGQGQSCAQAASLAADCHIGCQAVGCAPGAGGRSGR